MKTWRIIGILAIIGLLSAILVYKFVYNKPHQDYLKAKPEHTLTAASLFSAYVEDQAHADSIYTGKMVQIDGSIQGIEDLDSMVIAVFSFSQGIFGDEGIRCIMESSVLEEGRALSPGQNISIKGYCEGYNTTDVIIEHCSIIK